MRSEKKARAIACVVAIVLLIVIFIPKVSAVWQTSTGQIEGIRFYDRGWYLMEDDCQVDVELPYSKSVDAGIETSFYHRITPEEWGKLLYVPSFNEYFSVYADGVLIYERATVKSPKNDRVPLNGYNYVKIPEGTELISIVVSSPYNNCGGSLSLVYLADSEAPIVYMTQSRYQFNNFLDMMLILMGVVLFVYGIYLLCLREKGAMVTYLGCLVFCLGNWLRFGTVSVEIKYYSAVQVELISWFFWFMLPVSLCMFLSEYFDSRRRKYRAVAGLFLLHAVVNVCMVAMGAFDLPEMVSITYVMLAGLVVILLCDVIAIWHAGKAEEKKAGFAGFVILMITLFLELLQFYFTKMPTGSLIRYGIVICVVFIGVEELYRYEIEKMEILKREAEKRDLLLKATLSQLQPHFIFNALGAARLMIRTDSEAAYNMLYDFTQFLRANLRALQEKEMIPFSQELDQIKAYLNIEERRLKNRIQAVYEIETTDFMIPPLSIEPLVVNAVRNALQKGKNVGTVTLSTHLQGDTVIIEVADDGIGFQMNIWSAEQSDGEENCEGIVIEPDDDSYMGMSSICNRLKTMANAIIQIDSEPGKGTTVHIELKPGQ